MFAVRPIEFGFGMKREEKKSDESFQDVVLDDSEGQVAVDRASAL